VTPVGQDEGPDRDAAARIPPYLGAGPLSSMDSEAGPDSREQLRPFVLTSGRVQGAPDIGLETQVTALPAYGRSTNRLPPEMQAILALCREPVSVAEISARVGLHLGVTKILVGDLQAAGLLDIHAFDTAISHRPETIMRVIRGLRALS
jgi:hypothetical protein